MNAVRDIGREAIDNDADDIRCTEWFLLRLRCFYKLVLRRCLRGYLARSECVTIMAHPVSEHHTAAFYITCFRPHAEGGKASCV